MADETILGGTNQFALATKMTGTALIARLAGEIDRSSVDAASAQLMQAAVGLPPPDLVVLDLTAVSFFSAAGVHAVDAFATACAERGVRTHLVLDLDSAVYSVLSLTGLAGRLPAFTTLDQAV
jgi:anti-anti-sigma factor